MLLTTYTKGDRTIWMIVFLLAIISLPLIYSSTNTLALQKGISTNSFLLKQTFFIVLGMFLIYFTHKADYKVYSKLGVLIFALSIPLLIYTLLFGITINEAARWISIPGTGITIQTSEIAKTGLLLYICRYLARSQDNIRNFRKGIFPILIPIVLTILLTLKSSLSSAMYIGAISMVLLFIGRARIRHILSVLAIFFLPLMIIIGWVVVAHHTDTKPSQFPYGRVNVWVNRVDQFIYDSADEEHYQVKQSKIAIVKGGWFGVGPGNSEQKNFLPSAFSDYVFSTLIEEYGTFGAIVVILLYLILVYRSLRIFKKCPYAFGGFVAIALSINLLLSSVFNMLVNAHLLPVTGITLPFLSQGGTSFLISCFHVGIILSVSKSVLQNDGKKSAQEQSQVTTYAA